MWQLVLASGYLFVTRATFETSDHLFARIGKIGAVASSYSLWMIFLLKGHLESVMTFIREAHLGIHGFRKELAIKGATSGTTAPRPLSSIARRGEWSQGVVFDLYLQFAEPGINFSDGF